MFQNIPKSRHRRLNEKVIYVKKRHKNETRISYIVEVLASIVG
jgi:hypothetical protein